ncbi:MAG: hypothetical protein ACTSR2_13825 [Candidatus Hodarchaeales archaeon]
MLQSQIPVIVCLITCPKSLSGIVRDLKNHFELQKNSKLKFETYRGKLLIENIDVEVFLKLLPLEVEYQKERKSVYRNSIGAMYLYRQGDIESFSILKSLYEELRPLSAFSPYESLFIEIDDKNNKTNSKNETNGLEVELLRMNRNDREKFLDLLKIFIKNSNFFQATVKGSCDINYR